MKFLLNIKNKEFLIIAISIITFFVGFYLNEDSSGGGKLDFELHEWKNYLLFKNNGIYDSLTSLEFESSRTPLFLILNSINPFENNQFAFRLSNLILNLLLPFFLFIFLKKYISTKKVFLITSLIFLSPYFRTSSFWAHQENLPLIFMVLSFFLMSKYIDGKNIFFSRNNIFLIAIVSSLSFYSDQKYIFVSLICYLILIFTFKKKFLEISFIFFLTSIPALYLFYIWGGVLPIESQFRIGYYFQNFSYSLTIVSFYFLPIFINIFFSKKINSYFKDLKIYDFLILIIIVFFSFGLVSNFQNPWGYGVIYKAFYVLAKLGFNINLLNFILGFYFVIIIFFIYRLLLNSWTNFIPIITVSLITIFIERTYQEYFDPMIIILIFTFFKYKEFNPYNKSFLYQYLLFQIFFLVSANIYYQYFNLVIN